MGIRVDNLAAPADTIYVVRWRVNMRELSESGAGSIPGRALAWLGFYGVILAAWWVAFTMAPDCGPACGARPVGATSWVGFRVFYSMWAVMIAAMMLPTLLPVLRTYRDLPARTGAGTAGWVGLVLGYGLVWLLGAAGFAGAQGVARGAGWVAATGIVTSAWANAGLFVLAGGWQFSRTKTACQNVCLSPMQFFMARWRPGFVGGVRMGARSAVACVGCCWAIMSLGFVGGVMNLWWMGLATAFMVAEKLPGLGQHLRRPAGVALVGAGVVVALGAIGAQN